MEQENAINTDSYM